MRYTSLEKRNHNVYANIGQRKRITKRFAVDLNTGIGSSFIRLSERPEALRAKIREPDNMRDFQNASGKSVSMVGIIEIIIQIGTSTQAVNFLVAEKPATSVILGSTFVIDTWNPSSLD